MKVSALVALVLAALLFPAAGPAHAATTTCGETTGDLPHTRTTRHFLIHYGNIYNGLDIDDYARALERSWNVQIGRYGWAKPPTKAPGGRIHVRVGSWKYGGQTMTSGGMATAYGTYAGVVGDNPNTSWNDVDAEASCMAIGHRLSGWSNLMTLALHELHHVIQAGMGAISDANSDTTFTEGSAFWMQTEAQPKLRFALYPDLSESLGDYPYYPSNHWILFRGMTHRFGLNTPGGAEQVMQEAWESTSRNDERPVLVSLEGAMRRRGTTVGRAFHDAVIAQVHMQNCALGFHLPFCFQHSDNWNVGGYNRSTLEIRRRGGQVSGRVKDDYAAQIVRLPSDPSDRRAYDVVVANTASRGLMRVSVGCDTGNTIALHRPGDPVLGPGESARLGRIPQNRCYRGLDLVVTNERRSAPEPDDSPARSFTAKVRRASDRSLLSATKVGSGRGSVHGTGTYDKGRRVTLTADPAPGSAFKKWVGDLGPCTGTNPTCRVRLNKSEAVTAKFVDVGRPSRPVLVQPSGGSSASNSIGVRWRGSSDALSGVTAYLVRVRRGNGDWTTWQRLVESRRSATYRAPANGRYCFGVKAIDVAGNRSYWSGTECQRVT